MGLLARGVGRVVRIVAGVVLVGVGIFLLMAGSNEARIMVGVVGLVPLLTGLFDRWVFALLFGAPSWAYRFASACRPCKRRNR